MSHFWEKNHCIGWARTLLIPFITVVWLSWAQQYPSWGSSEQCCMARRNAARIICKKTDSKSLILGQKEKQDQEKLPSMLLSMHNPVVSELIMLIQHVSNWWCHDGSGNLFQRSTNRSLVHLFLSFTSLRGRRSVSSYFTHDTMCGKKRCGDHTSSVTPPLNIHFQML